MWENEGEVHARLNNARRVLPNLSWQAERERFISYYQHVIARQADAEPQGSSLAAEPSTKPRF